MPSEAEKIALLLKEKYPDLNPLTVRLSDIRVYMADLQGCPSVPDTGDVFLESVQMAWLEEIQEQ